MMILVALSFGALTLASGSAGAQELSNPGPITWAASSTDLCTIDLNTHQATYHNGSVNLFGTFYRPDGPGPFPAVLVLHTRGGFTPLEIKFASWLAAQGYVALAPDYFKPRGVNPSTYMDAFSVQTDAIREDLARGLDCLKTLPYVDAQRLGAVGFSMGGYFGQLLATRDDVSAIVSHYGVTGGEGVSRLVTRYTYQATARQIRAPMLLLHGDQDDEVPLAVVRRSADVLNQLGKGVELVVYPGVGHAWDRNTSQYVYDAPTSADAQRRTLAFFDAKLGKSPTTSGPAETAPAVPLTAIPAPVSADGEPEDQTDSTPAMLVGD